MTEETGEATGEESLLERAEEGATELAHDVMDGVERATVTVENGVEAAAAEVERVADETVDALSQRLTTVGEVLREAIPLFAGKVDRSFQDAMARIGYLPAGSLDLAEAVAGLNLSPVDLQVFAAIAASPLENRAVLQKIAGLDAQQRAAVAAFLIAQG